MENETRAVAAITLDSRLDNQFRVAQVLSQSNIIKRLNKTAPYNAQDLLYLMMLGEKLGIPAETAVHAIWLVEGRPVVSARMCRALIHKNGHTWRVVEWTSARVVIEAGRKGQKPTQFETKIEEAKQAGLLTRGPWQKTPKPMLMAMATRRVVDACFADLFLGMTAYDELEREDMQTVETAPEKPAKRKLTLKKISSATSEPTAELFEDEVNSENAVD